VREKKQPGGTPGQEQSKGINIDFNQTDQLSTQLMLTDDQVYWLDNALEYYVNFRIKAAQECVIQRDSFWSTEFRQHVDCAKSLADLLRQLVGGEYDI
jgi:hypothetical protein